MPQSTTSAGRVDAAERRSETSQMKHLQAQPVPCVSVRAFLVWRRARAVTAVPVPSRARPLTYACITPLLEGWSMRAWLCRRTNAHAN